MTSLPDLMGEFGAGDETRRFIEVGRWPIIFFAVIIRLGLLYKIAPNRPTTMSPWVFIGALGCRPLVVGGRLDSPYYSNNLGSFSATYGTLAGIIVLLRWFFISDLVVLAGAELSAEFEYRGLACHHHRALAAWR